MINNNTSLDITYIKDFVSNLKNEEYDYLVYFLKNKNSDKNFNTTQNLLTANELLIIETWLFEQIEKSKNSKTRLARKKIWGIFIFLRYAALTPAEIFSLTEKNFDFANGCIQLTAQNPRVIKLPLNVCRRLQKVFTASEFPPDLKFPLRSDSGFLRRSLQRCAARCALAKGLVNARTIRNSRLQELKSLGLPTLALNILTAKACTKHTDPFQIKMATQLLQEYCQMESPIKTSARNVFQGRVESIEHAGFMVRVTIRTSGGLNIAALITDKSYYRLQIMPGKILTASIKAPWVTVQPLLEDKTDLLTSQENTFIGSIETVRSDALLSEITAVLADGSLVCSLQEKTSYLPKAGDRVFVLIKALAVVLHADLG
ncbi:MAG: TOBE domain-containing protein [Desulfovibrio sp.]|nr:TOBE domain-containing protein [Desulfovibrio sp.]